MDPVTSSRADLRPVGRVDQSVVALQLVDQQAPVLLVVVDLEVAHLSDVEQHPLVRRGNIWQCDGILVNRIFSSRFQLGLSVLTSWHLEER